jgi:hypothetical protein
LNHIREILRLGGTGGRGYFVESEDAAIRAGNIADLFYREPVP